MKTALATNSCAGVQLKTSRNLRIVQFHMKEEFRAKVEKIMRESGASDDFIKRTLTDHAVQEAISNHFSAESVAWALLQ